MFQATLVSIVLASRTFVCLEGEEPRPPVIPPAIACDACGANLPAIAGAIQRLRSDPDGDGREDAARSLRSLRWICHPDVVHALSDALLRDPDGDVREQAAESLTRLDACDPEAHLALGISAARDPRPGVRNRARRGLRSLSHRCAGECLVCGPPWPPAAAHPGIGIVVPIPRPARRFVPTTEIVSPGVRVVVNPRPLPYVRSDIPMQRSPSTPTEPLLEPLPSRDDTPPPPPTPAPARPGSSVIPPPGPPERSSSLAPPDTAVRRTMAKPVAPAPIRSTAPTVKPTTPPSSLPPLEGPSGSG